MTEFLQNKYRRWYDELVARAVGRELNGYCECHHILPRSLGGSNDKSNLATLTYREHFLAHWLLTKCTWGDDRTSMLHALYRMSHLGSNRKQKIIIASWQYALARKAHRDANLGNAYCRGFKHTTEMRAKVSASLIGNTRNVGRKLSAEMRAAISASKRGQKHSPETRAKLSAAGKRVWAAHPEDREKLRARMVGNRFNTGRMQSAEERAKLSAATKQMWAAAPELRAKVAAANRRRHASIIVLPPAYRTRLNMEVMFANLMNRNTGECHK